MRSHAHHLLQSATNKLRRHRETSRLCLRASYCRVIQLQQRKHLHAWVWLFWYIDAGARRGRNLVLRSFRAWGAMVLQMRQRRRAAIVLQALVRGRSDRTVFEKMIEANTEAFWLDLRRCHDVYQKNRTQRLLGYNGTELDCSGCHKVFLIRRTVEFSVSV